jgi:hypothetical protein
MEIWGISTRDSDSAIPGSLQVKNVTEIAVTLLLGYRFSEMTEGVLNVTGSFTMPRA